MKTKKEDLVDVKVNPITGFKDNKVSAPEIEKYENSTGSFRNNTENLRQSLRNLDDKQTA